MTTRFAFKGFIQPVGLIVLGGLFATIVSGRISGQQIQRVPQPLTLQDSRLTATTVKMAGGYAEFIRDTKTNGCWLYVQNAAGNSLAQAPTEACSFK